MDEGQEDNLAEAFHAWVRDQSSNPNVLSTQGVELHRGRRVYKSATLRSFGNRETGTVSRTELSLGSYPRRMFGPGFDFDDPTSTWRCDNEEIDRVRALLTGEFNDGGYYVRVERGSALSGLAEAMQSGELQVDSVTGLIESLAAVPGVAEALASTDLVQLVAATAERERHRTGLTLLQSAVEDAATTEASLQAILEEHWWMFGSRYVGTTARRKLTLLDQFDIPLVRADGALHVVELKRACIPRLVIDHRDNAVLGPDVHLAVSQAQSYLAALDRQESIIRAEFGLECRRAFATVVIGHPMHCHSHSADQISEALRIYNSHLSRVEVITYEDLIQGAANSILISTDEDRSGEPTEQT